MQLIRIWRKSAAIAITPVAVKGFQFPIAYFRRGNPALKQRLILVRLNGCIRTKRGFVLFSKKKGEPPGSPFFFDLICQLTVCPDAVRGGSGNHKFRSLAEFDIIASLQNNRSGSCARADSGTDCRALSAASDGAD